MSQRVLITAGAAGIGLEMVRAFVVTSAKVYTCDINGGALDQLAKDIPGVQTSVCDVSKRDHRRPRRVSCRQSHFWPDAAD